MHDLVLKINDKCNFGCAFCSSNKIAKNHENLDIEIVKEYLRNNDIHSLIINGGDPLMVDPEYYWQILEYTLTYLKKPVRLALTTNLLDFYEQPSKWVKLFKHEQVDVCTSFQYGTKRRLKTGEIFTEDMFLKFMDKFYRLIGYAPSFISVIDEENEKYCIKTVELAKMLNTTCRLNPTLKSGRATKAYPYYKMFKIYLDIMEAGLGKYENNCVIIKRVWQEGNANECPYNRSCRTDLGSLSPGGEFHTCPSIADDIFSKVIDINFRDPDTCMEFDKSAIHESCYKCPMFLICNSCFKRIQDITDGIYGVSQSEAMSNINNHCKQMKKLYNRAAKIMGEPA